MIIFVLLSKGMGLGICFVTIEKAIHNIDTISVDYSDVEGNREAIVELLEQKTLLKSAFSFDLAIAGLMIFGFLMQGMTMTKPLRSAPRAVVAE